MKKYSFKDTEDGKLYTFTGTYLGNVFGDDVKLYSTEESYVVVLDDSKRWMTESLKSVIVSTIPKEKVVRTFNRSFLDKIFGKTLYTLINNICIEKIRYSDKRIRVIETMIRTDCGDGFFEVVEIR